MNSKPYSKMDFLSEKKETAKSFRAFLESKEAKNGIDLDMAKVLLAEFEELFQISQNLYNSALKNIAAKRVLETKIENYENTVKRYDSKHYDFILVESGYPKQELYKVEVIG